MRPDGKRGKGAVPRKSALLTIDLGAAEKREALAHRNKVRFVVVCTSCLPGYLLAPIN